MARILKFRRHRREQPAIVDATKVWAYVVPRLEFPLPAFITREIDSIIGEIWNSSESEIDFYDCVGALEGLQGRDILIPSARREKIVTLIFEYLEEKGFFYRSE